MTLRSAMSERSNVYFDMTEALMAFGGKNAQYYGIARTVHEVGKALAQLETQTCFVVYSFAYRRFFKISHRIDADGEVVFDFPSAFSQTKMRTVYRSSLLTAALQGLDRFRAGRNRRIWDFNARYFAPVELKPGVFISLARPKLLVDPVWTVLKDQPSVAVVPLLHDLMPLYKDKRRRFSSFARNFLNDNRFLIENAAAVLTNSVFTKNEIEHFVAQGLLPATPPMEAVPLVQFCPEGKEPPALELPQTPFVLSVGPNLGNKNIELTFSALLALHRSGRPVPDFVIAGTARRRIRDYVAGKDFDPIRDKIRFIGNPSQTDLVRLYRGALALIIPSRMEGWGLPAGEALWCGTPVIASTAPALKEACGDLALYVDPDDSEGLADSISRLMVEPETAAALRAAIASHHPSFRTWDDVARDVVIAALRHAPPASRLAG